MTYNEFLILYALVLVWVSVLRTAYTFYKLNKSRKIETARGKRIHKRMEFSVKFAIFLTTKNNRQLLKGIKYA